MSHFFQFEADFVDSLRCIPMQVRLKLDTSGIKLKLPQWHQFTDEDRQALVNLPCETDSEIQTYREFLQQRVLERTGSSATELPIDVNPDWLNPSQLPASVQDKAAALQVTITTEQWARLTPLQRFALIKLSRSGHENNNFLPALEEFHLT